MLNTLDCIIFDADETLFAFDAFRGLQKMFQAYDVAFSADDYQAYQAVNKPLWVDYQDGKITAAQLQTRRFIPWATRLNVSPETLNNQFLLAMADICQPLDGAAALLDSLKAKSDWLSSLTGSRPYSRPACNVPDLGITLMPW